MAGSNFFARVVSYFVNEVVVEGLANNRTFQRFAVKTSKNIEELTRKAAKAKEEIAEQLRNNDSFKR